MSTSMPHPNPEDLKAFRRGELSGARADSIAKHVARCARCREFIEVPEPVSARKSKSDSSPADSAPRTRMSGQYQRVAKADTAPRVVEGLPSELAGYSKYRFEKELGRGGMGVVYRATQTLMERTVAVKVINPAVLAHP